MNRNTHKAIANAEYILSIYGLNANKYELTSGGQFKIGDSIFMGYLYIDIGKNVKSIPEEMIVHLQASIRDYKVEFKDLS